MKLLADVGIAMSSIESLRKAGHDCVHLRDEGLHRLPDSDILEKARNEQRILLAFDLDFGELLAAGLYDSPSVVILRLRDQRPGSVTPRLLDVLKQHGAELSQGCVISVEESRYRIRHLPIVPAP